VARDGLPWQSWVAGELLVEICLCCGTALIASAQFPVLEALLQNLREYHLNAATRSSLEDQLKLVEHQKLETDNYWMECVNDLLVLIDYALTLLHFLTVLYGILHEYYPYKNF
jgi:hypothetical protein